MSEPVKHPCPRCGYVREARPTSLCQDCRDVLKPHELPAWYRTAA